MINYKNPNQALKNNLLNVMMTVDEDKKTAVYAAVAHYMLSNNIINIASMVDENKEVTGVCRRALVTLTYDINDIAVIDRELFQDVMIRYIKAKKAYTDGMSRLIPMESKCIDDVEASSVYYGIYKPAINKEFNAFRETYNTLASLGLEFSF